MKGHPQYVEGEATRRRMLTFIAGHQDQHGWAPSVREIAEGVGLASPSSVQRHLQVLSDRGDLVLGGGPRMIRLTNGRIALRSSAGPITTSHGDDGRLQPGLR